MHQIHLTVFQNQHLGRRPMIAPRIKSFLSSSSQFPIDDFHHERHKDAFHALEGLKSGRDLDPVLFRSAVVDPQPARRLTPILLKCQARFLSCPGLKAFPCFRYIRQAGSRPIPDYLKHNHKRGKLVQIGANWCLT